MANALSLKDEKQGQVGSSIASHAKVAVPKHKKKSIYIYFNIIFKFND